MHTILFNLFASLAVATGIGVIVSKNPVHSVIFLILVFCNATGLLLLLKVELLAMMFIIIYVGAIAVLFLFVVMMLNIKRNELNVNDLKVNENNEPQDVGLACLKKQLKVGALGKSRVSMQKPLTMSLSILIGLIVLLLTTATVGNLNNNMESLYSRAGQGEIINQMNILWNNQESLQKPWVALIDSVTNIQSLGYLIYTYYFYYFFMSGLILLIAMIGAIVLTMYKRKMAKKQLVYRQIASKAENVLASCASQK